MQRKAYIPLVIVILSILSIHAKTLYVPDNYPTITGGIDAASDGDTVLVSPGEYYEGIDFNGKKIVVASKFLLTKDSSFIESTVIRDSLANPNSDLYAVPELRNTIIFDSTENSSSILCGFTILDIMISISNNSSPLLSCLKIKGMAEYHNYGGSPGFLSVLKVTNNVPYILTGILFENSWVRFSNVQNSRIHHCCFLKDRISIDLGKRPELMFDNNSLVGSIVTDNSYNIDTSDNLAVFFNNKFINSAISLGSTAYIKVEDNTFIKTDTLSTCTIALSEGYASVTGNILKNCHLVIKGKSVISHNAIAVRKGLAVVIFDELSDSCLFLNNSVVGSKVGMKCFKSSSFLRISNCILWGNDTDIVNIDKTQISYSLIGKGIDPGLQGNISGDPMFIDTSIDDFHLRKGSPCIDAGDPLSNKDPDGSRADIGAFPYQEGYVVSTLQAHSAIKRAAPVKPSLFLTLSDFPNNIRNSDVFDIRGRKISSSQNSHWRNIRNQAVVIVRNKK